MPFSLLVYSRLTIFLGAHFLKHPLDVHTWFLSNYGLLLVIFSPLHLLNREIVTAFSIHLFFSLLVHNMPVWHLHFILLDTLISYFCFLKSKSTCYGNFLLSMHKYSIFLYIIFSHSIVQHINMFTPNGNYVCSFVSIYNQIKQKPTTQKMC